MKPVSMKLEEAERGDSMSCCGCCGPSSWPDYGYGLRINLSDAELRKLGFARLPAPGEAVTLEGVAVVVSASEEPGSDGNPGRRDLTLQITDLAASAKNTSRFARMYEGDETMKD